MNALQVFISRSSLSRKIGCATIKPPRVRTLEIRNYMRFVLLATFLVLPLSVDAQQTTGEVVSVVGTEIRIDGPLSQTVAGDFLRKLQANPDLETVSLNSPGGSVFPALDIARTISISQLDTSVPIGDECHSACSFIFLSGRERIADGLLGVHQVSGVNDPSLTQTAIGEIYEELVRFNTPTYLISRMLRTPPADMYIFTPEELELHSINIRDYESQAGSIPHLLALETWTFQDWLVGVFQNTNINRPFIALESREMSPLLRIAHYPHRSQTFVEIMYSDRTISGVTSRIELRFGHGTDQPFSLFVDADIDQNNYAFDMPQDPAQAEIFWAAFSSGTDLTVLNGYGVEIGRFGLMGSRRAFEDFMVMVKR